MDLSFFRESNVPAMIIKDAGATWAAFKSNPTVVKTYNAGKKALDVVNAVSAPIFIASLTADTIQKNKDRQEKDAQEQRALAQQTTGQNLAAIRKTGAIAAAGAAVLGKLLSGLNAVSGAVSVGGIGISVAQQAKQNKLLAEQNSRAALQFKSAAEVPLRNSFKLIFDKFSAVQDGHKLATHNENWSIGEPVQNNNVAPLLDSEKNPVVDLLSKYAEDYNL